jgi:hypothetical protein
VVKFRIKKLVGVSLGPEARKSKAERDTVMTVIACQLDVSRVFDGHVDGDTVVGLAVCRSSFARRKIETGFDVVGLFVVVVAGVNVARESKIAVILGGGDELEHRVAEDEAFVGDYVTRLVR